MKPRADTFEKIIEIDKPLPRYVRGRKKEKEQKIPCIRNER